MGAGIYGVVALAPLYFLEERIGRDLPPAITHPEVFYGFVGVALAWQVLFFVLARDPARFRPIMLPAVLEKLSYAVAAIVLFALGRAGGPVLATGLIDLALAGLFVEAWRRTPPCP
jgi:hypothetical protein